MVPLEPFLKVGVLGPQPWSSSPPSPRQWSFQRPKSHCREAGKSTVEPEFLWPICWLSVFTPVIITPPSCTIAHCAGTTLSIFTDFISLLRQPREQLASCCYREESEAQGHCPRSQDLNASERGPKVRAPTLTRPFIPDSLCIYFS